MGRIEQKFEELGKVNKKALITFVTAGDPDMATTARIVKEMEKRGADIIELGIPYSDPVAEGPVIQLANKRALKNGVKIKDIMGMVCELRREVKVPILFLLYFNCILQYGPESFFSDCKSAGVDGVIIPDLPYEERGEISSAADASEICIITLISPASGKRVSKIANTSRGFLYCVSSLGVTGMRSEFSTNFDEFFSQINSVSKIPKAIGFGISSPEHIRMLKGYCDGIIVGSAIVSQVGASTSSEMAVENVGSYVELLRNAMDS